MFGLWLTTITNNEMAIYEIVGDEEAMHQVDQSLLSTRKLSGCQLNSRQGNLNSKFPLVRGM